MIGIATLSKRIERLEPVPDPQPDIVGAVLSSLSDDHISLLEEHSVLLEHGFSEPDISVMMITRYPDALKAAEIFRERYAAIYTKMHPPRTPPKKQRKSYTRHRTGERQV
jgi:hypothetical protein